MPAVKCLICGEEFTRGIKFHLKKSHGICSKEYREMFPGAQVISDKELEEKRSRVHSPEEIAKLVERNKSQRMRDIISERNRNPEFQKKCQEGCTEETRKSQSENMRKVSKKCWEDPDYRENHCQIARETQARESQRSEVKKRKSEMFKKLWNNSEFSTKAISAPKNHPYGRQSWYTSSKFNKEFYCRSQGESDFLSFCESSDDVINVESGVVFPITYFVGNDEHVYIPDFIVKTKNISYIVEIKYEDDLIENHKDKVNSAVDFCKNHNMRFCYVNRFSGIKKIKENGFESVEVLERI